MRSRTRPGLNKKYFHTKPRFNKRDITILKTKIEFINQRKLRNDLDSREKKKIW